tara:strand:+ start:19432 stop:20604 length:1173 start_codon:yes stop_codon:yes gene_type:complete
VKILFTQDALVNAGAERSHLEILSRFADQLDVSLVYFYPKHDLKEEYKKAGIRLVFLNIPESYHFGKAIFRLVKLIRAEKPDLLVSSLWRADIITRIASIITGVPLIGTLVNDSYSPMAWKDKKGLKYKVVHWLDRLTAGIPKHWIANAQALADSHVKTLGLDPKKISVVYRGRSVPVIAPARRGDSERTKRSINKEKDCFVPRNDGYRFLSYGRLLERKGFQDAIQAFELVNQKYPNSSLTIYGEGPYRSNLESLITKLGLTDHVKLPGKVPNPDCLLPTAHCFLFPSWYEGFSGALVEAMMAGIPIIASDISMNLEAITDRQNAIVFPVKNIDSLKFQMQFAIENPELMEEFGQNARMTAIQRFDIEKIAKEYEGVLLEVFKRSVNHA